MSSQRVVDAVGVLIGLQNADEIIIEMRAILNCWSKNPMAYGGKLAPLNAILDVGIQNREAFEKIVAFIEKRRTR